MLASRGGVECSNLGGRLRTAVHFSECRRRLDLGGTSFLLNNSVFNLLSNTKKSGLRCVDIEAVYNVSASPSTNYQLIVHRFSFKMEDWKRTLTTGEESDSLN